MDRFNAMLVFTRIVELGGFARAADSLQMPRASVTVLIKQLEAHLGVQLLHRTTRQVSPTLDGAAYYQRCVSVLSDLEEAEGVFSASQPTGTLRVEMPVAVGRLVVLPALPRLVMWLCSPSAASTPTPRKPSAAAAATPWRWSRRRAA